MDLALARATACPGDRLWCGSNNITIHHDREASNVTETTPEVVDKLTTDMVPSRPQSDAAQKLISSVENAKPVENNDLPQQTGNKDYDKLLTAIEAMPESIVKAIREAFPAPQAPKRTKSDGDVKVVTKAVEPKADQPKDTNDKQPGKRSFSQMWFGQ